ncbi:hypothetical protein LTR02_003885 [Friedmanniomyces endolithicus]|nr:hypothetical protein LTR59_015156 [Friedmanniomyces endolithicus]KAK0781427.1 hypothetical protein LTR38_013747 [Friedmanniomyces endolithicus]KAK0862569.1 hypothetical protein LTS02_007078 [Friedmanniomyces endolithicus]KAK0880413.1 hypothetical protein LTR87_005692 [Friedmanniomyces endolithicus]KAK0910275.1 hypothetical protein LTR02_003885 [Friedmanniomyces endolithicus]
MHEIPRRLGVNKALDAAVATVVEAHSSFCSRRPASTRGLLLYSVALSNLRASLDDVGTACSNETLCAVMVLMACQSLMGLNNGAGSGHSEGAIKLLKARGPPNPDDMFETELVMCQLEGIFNEEIEMMLPDPPGSRYSEVSVLNTVSQTQGLIRRWSGPHGLGIGDATIVEDAKEFYKISQDAIEEWRAITKAMDQRMTLAKTQPLVLVHEHARLHQYLGLLIAVTIILNCIVSAIDRDHSATLTRERTALILESLALVEGVADYSPLGCTHVGLSLGACWIGHDDPVTRAAIEVALDKHTSTEWPAPETSRLISNLSFAAGRFHQRLLRGSQAVDD